MKTILEYLYNKKGAIKSEDLYLIMTCSDICKYEMEQIREKENIISGDFWDMYSNMMIGLYICNSNILEKFCQFARKNLNKIHRYDFYLFKIEKNRLKNPSELLDNILRISTRFKNYIPVICSHPDLIELTGPQISKLIHI